MLVPNRIQRNRSPSRPVNGNISHKAIKRVTAEVAKEEMATSSPLSNKQQDSSSRLAEMRQTVLRLREDREKLRTTCEEGSSNYTNDRDDMYRLQQKMANINAAAAAASTSLSQDAMKSRKFDLRRQYLESKYNSFKAQGTATTPLPNRQQQQDDIHPSNDTSTHDLQDEEEIKVVIENVSTMPRHSGAFHEKDAQTLTDVPAMVYFDKVDEKEYKTNAPPLLLQGTGDDEEDRANDNKALPVLEIMEAYSLKRMEKEQAANNDESPLVVEAMARWSHKWLKEEEGAKESNSLPRKQKTKGNRSRRRLRVLLVVVTVVMAGVASLVVGMWGRKKKEN